MKNKSIRKLPSRIMAVMLAMILCMATSVTAFAGTGGSASTPQKAVITKNLQYADATGVTPPNATFTFTGTASSKDGLTDATTLSSMPALTANITFTGSETATSPSTGMKQVSSTVDLIGNVSWTSTGTYKYTVAETADTYSLQTGEKMVYSQAEYTLTVVVAYDSASGMYYAAETYLEKLQNDDGTTGTGKGEPNDPTDATYNFYFLNTYSIQGGTTAGDEALTISKAITGTGASATQQFEFTLTASDSVTGTAAANYDGKIYNSGGTQTGTITLTADGTTAATFKLTGGDYVVFDTLPAGTTFTVNELAVANYKASYSGAVSAGSISNANTTTNTALSTGSQKVGAGMNNTVGYTNEYDNSLIPTGVLSNIAPFVAIIAVAVIAFVAFAAMNRRKASR